MVPTISHIPYDFDCSIKSEWHGLGMVVYMLYVQISKESLDKLEELQNTLYRMLLAVPRTTPVPSLAWDLGGVKMKFRIITKKLLFVHHLTNLGDQSLAKAWCPSAKTTSRNTSYQIFLRNQ